MEKLFLSIVSVMTAVALMVFPASAAFELDGVQAKERNPGVTEQNEVLSMSREIENPIRFEIPCAELNLMQYTNDDTPKQGKEILNDALIAEMKKINPDFETEYYSVFYNPSGGLLFLSKVIPTEYRNVFVGVGYSIYIENGIALELFYTDIPTQKQFYQEETLSERIRIFVENGGENVQLPDIPNALVEVDEDHVFYSYDSETDELTYTVGYEVTHLDEDGAMSAHEIVVPVPRVEKKRTDKIFLVVSGGIVFILMGFLCLGKFKIKKEKITNPPKKFSSEGLF